MKYLIIFLILIFSVYAICDGCLLNNECIKVGVQRLTDENGYEVYCGQDKVVYKAKEDGEGCNNDYECLSYYCDNSCKDIKKGSSFMRVFGIIGLVILILAIIYFVYKKRPRRVITRRVSVRKGAPRKVVVKKRTDPLEKGIKESLDNLSSVFKKRKP